jgi:putative inorganic carbon (HCO3(-)) transporter
VATLAALAGLVVGWVVTAVLRREAWPLTPLNGALVLFVPAVGVGILVSALPDLTLPKATGMILGLAAFRAVSAAHTPPLRRLVLAAFVAAGLVILVVGALSAGWLAKVPGAQALLSRLPAPLLHLPEAPEQGVHPNELAGVLTLYLPLPLAALLGWRPAWRQSVLALVALLGLALLGGTLLLTQSRSGWLGGIAGLLALVVLVALRSRRSWVRVLGLLLPLVLLLAGGVFLAQAGAGTIQRAYDGVTADALATPAGTITLQGRVEVWSRALYAIEDFSFTGCGLGTFRRVVQVLYPLFLTSPDQDIAHAHNAFLQVAVDLGLPGLIAYLALLGAAVGTAWVASRPGREDRWLALALLAGLVGFHAYGLTDTVALGAKPGLAFWLLLGLVATLPWAREGIAAEAPAGARPWLGRHRRAVAGAVAVLLVALGLAGYFVWPRAPWAGAPPPGPALRLPIYPGAAKSDVHLEDPPAGGDWQGKLEVGTFSTTQALTDVLAFYTETLGAGGWHTEIAAGDATSWGGIYTRDGGRAVCLLNLFAVEGQVWGSLVCGDKTEPVDLPALRPSGAPTGTAAPSQP